MRILKIRVKCSDMFSAELIIDENIVGNYDGYVPKFFPGRHHGDYLQLDIDIDTGNIINWNKPEQNELDKVISSK